MKAETNTWTAGPYIVITKHRNSASGVEVTDRKGRRLYFEPLRWGPSRAAAIAWAARDNRPEEMTSVLWFLFSRIDGYQGPSILDAWEHGNPTKRNA